MSPTCAPRSDPPPRAKLPAADRLAVKPDVALHREAPVVKALRLHAQAFHSRPQVFSLPPRPPRTTCTAASCCCPLGRRYDDDVDDLSDLGSESERRWITIPPP